MTEERLEKILRETKFENNEHKEALRARLQRKGQELEDNIRKLEDIFADAELVREMAAAETPEDARRWFMDHGVELSMSEIDELGKAFASASAKKVELDLDELEDVAGGRFGPAINTSSYLEKLAGRVLANGIFIPNCFGSIRDEGEEQESLSDSIKWGRK